MRAKRRDDLAQRFCVKHEELSGKKYSGLLVGGGVARPSSRSLAAPHAQRALTACAGVVVSKACTMLVLLPHDSRARSRILRGLKHIYLAFNVRDAATISALNPNWPLVGTANLHCTWFLHAALLVLSWTWDHLMLIKTSSHVTHREKMRFNKQNLGQNGHFGMEEVKPQLLQEWLAGECLLPWPCCSSARNKQHCPKFLSA